MANSFHRWLQIERSIRQVLLQHWDPIGVRDNPKSQDHYDDYIAPIYWMLVQSRSEEELAAFLHRTRTQELGLTDWFGGTRNRRVARQLLALDVSGDQPERKEERGR